MIFQVTLLNHRRRKRTQRQMKSFIQAIQARKYLYLYNPYFYLLDIPQYPGKKMFVFIIHTFIFLIFHNIQAKIFVFIIYTFIFLIFHNIQAKIFVFIKSVFFSLWKKNRLTNRLTNWQVHPTQDPVRSSQNKYQGENKIESKNKGKRLRICQGKNGLKLEMKPGMRIHTCRVCTPASTLRTSSGQGRGR